MQKSITVIYTGEVKVPFMKELLWNLRVADARTLGGINNLNREIWSDTTMEKIVKEFASMYGKALIACGNQVADVKITAFTKRLEQMYASDIFKQHNVYPSMGVDRIYAVIAVCLELKDDGMSDPEIIDFVNQIFRSV